MTRYIQDRCGTYWRAGQFTSYRVGKLANGERVIRASYPDPETGHERQAEFWPAQWGDSVNEFLPALPDHHAIYTQLVNGKIVAETVPIIAWKVDQAGCIWPVTIHFASDGYEEHAVLHPNGQVVEWEGTWPSMEEFLAQREKELLKLMAHKEATG